jgi:hypothetical protein
MAILAVAAPAFALLWMVAWVWCLIDVGQRNDLSSGQRWLWILALLFIPVCTLLYAVFFGRAAGLRKLAIFNFCAGLLVGGYGTYRAIQEMQFPVAELGAWAPTGMGAEEATAPPPTGGLNATTPEGIFDPAKPAEVLGNRRPTIPDPPTPPPPAPGLPERAFPAAAFRPLDLRLLAFTGARPRWTPVALDGSLGELGDPLPAGVRAHAQEVGGGAAWVIWKDRLCLLDAEGGDPLPLPAPEELPPVLYPRDLVWIPRMKTLLVLARNGGFYMQPSDDATPARWRHMPAFARLDLRALAFDDGGGRLYGLVQRQEELVTLVRLAVSGEVAEEVPLVPPLASGLRTAPGDLQLRPAAAGLLLLRPGAPGPGRPPAAEAWWIDPATGAVALPVEE